MIDPQQIHRLVALSRNRFPITSLYLNMGRDWKASKTRFKDLVSERREEIRGGSFSPQEKESIEKDFEKIRDYLESLREPRPKSLALFSSGGGKHWYPYLLAQPLKDLLVVDSVPYIRPLMDLLDQSKRCGVLLVDRNQARILEIFMGEIAEATELRGDVPKRVREGGWYGLEEKRIDRHVEQHLHDFMKQVIDHTLAVLQERPFQWLFLGGSLEVVATLEEQLPSSLRSRLKKTFRIDLNASAQEVLAKAEELLQQIEREEDQALVSRLREALMPGGLGVSGIHETLSSLHEGSVHSLLIEEGFSEPGARCAHCRFLGLQVGACPICGHPMGPVGDVINEALLQAIDRDASIFMITPGVGLEKLGRIGALLRYKPTSGKK